MVLTADIGNTFTTIALFDPNGQLTLRSTFSTDAHATQDQYAIQLFSILQLYQVEQGQITGGIIASVVPSATAPLAGAVERLIAKKPLVVGAGIRTGLDIRADMHAQLGADIVAYCVEASAKYPGPVIVVDFGTAITFSLLKGNIYEGCIICPGVQVSMEALSLQAAELPHISLSEPATLLGHNTVDAMRSGGLYGSASLVDGILDRLEATAGPVTSVVATGSYAGDVVRYCRRTIIQDPDLLLNGLRRLYEKNLDPRQRG